MTRRLSTIPSRFSTSVQRNVIGNALLLLIVTVCLSSFYQSPTNDSVIVTNNVLVAVVHAYDVSPPYDPYARRYRHHHYQHQQYDHMNNFPPVDHTQYQTHSFDYDDNDDDDVWPTERTTRRRRRTPPPPPETGGFIPPIHQYTAETSVNRGIHPVKSIWDTSAPVLVEGSSLQTWGFESMDVERVQVLLRAPSRPALGNGGGGVVGDGDGPISSSSSPLVFQASVDVWQGPDNTPQRMFVYMEDNQQHHQQHGDYSNDDDDDDDDCYDGTDDDEGGTDVMSSTSSSSSTPFTAIIETPGGFNTVAIRNTATSMDHPVLACVEADHHSVGGNDSDNYHNNHPNPSTRSAYHYNSQRRTTEPNRRKKAPTTPNGTPSGPCGSWNNNNINNPYDYGSNGFTGGGGSPGSQNGRPPPVAGSALQAVTDRLLSTSTPHQVEGGGDATAYTFELAPNIASVQVLLSTDYQRPLEARIELALIEEDVMDHDDDYDHDNYQQYDDDGRGGYHRHHHDGDDNIHDHYNSQTFTATRPPVPRILKRCIVEVVSEDAMSRPFFAVLETPRNRLLNASYRTSSDDNYCNNDDDNNEDDNVMMDDQYDNHGRDHRRKRRRRRQQQRPTKLTIQMRVSNLSPSYAGFPIYAFVEPYVIDTETSTTTTTTTTTANTRRRRRGNSSSQEDSSGSNERRRANNDNSDYNDQNNDNSLGNKQQQQRPPQQEILSSTTSKTTTTRREFKNRHTTPPFGSGGNTKGKKNNNVYNATIVDIELS